MKTKLTFSKFNLDKAFKLHYNTKYPLRSRLMLFVGLFILISGLVLFYFNMPKDSFILKYVFLIVGVLYTLLYFYRRNKIFERASNQKTFQGEFEFEINEKNISFSQNGGVSKLPMNQISDVVQDEYNFLFYFGKNQFYILPKNILDPENLNSVINIIKKK